MANHAQVRREPASDHRPSAAAAARAMPIAAAPSATAVLQRRLGNQGTQALLRARIGAGARATPAVEESRSAIERRPETATLQTSSRDAISQPGDALEQEADRIADQVMRMPHPAAAVATERASVLQRSAAGAAVHETVPPIVHEVLRSPGRPLDRATRDFMEPRFGQDFGGVRVHTDAQADQASRSVQARAFTYGRDIAFRQGEYEPHSAKGLGLLAHELTHTLQQGGQHRIQRQPLPHAAVQAAPAGRATVNFLPVIHDQVPTDWGVTVEDDVIIDITAYASGGVWKCVITTADQQARQGTRLLPGVVDVTPALVAAETSCPTLQTMITSLNSVTSTGVTAGPDSGFYMLSAVQAHENVHITQYRADLAPHYTTLKTAVEALTVPLAGSADAVAAKAAIKALPAFTAAMATFHAGDVAANNATANHKVAAPFLAAMRRVVDPMIVRIKARRTALKCPP